MCPNVHPGQPDGGSASTYLHGFGLGERGRAGVQELLLADADLLHVTVQQPLHLGHKKRSWVTLQSQTSVRSACTHQRLVLHVDVCVRQLILFFIIEN